MYVRPYSYLSSEPPALVLILMMPNPLADGCQALKYSYDEFTYLRSSVEIPLA